MVKKDFKGSFEDKAMSLSSMANPSTNYLGEDLGKRRRMSEIGAKVLRKELEQVREQIRETDMSADKKRKTLREAQLEMQKIGKQFRSLLGFKKQESAMYGKSLLQKKKKPMKSKKKKRPAKPAGKGMY